MSTKVNDFMLSFFFSWWVLEAVPPTDTISTCSKIATAVSQSHLPIAQAPPQMWDLQFSQETGIKEESSCKYKDPSEKCLLSLIFLNANYFQIPWIWPIAPINSCCHKWGWSTLGWSKWEFWIAIIIKRNRFFCPLLPPASLVYMSVMGLFSLKNLK